MKHIAKTMQGMCVGFLKAVRRRGGEIVYYGGVALALTAIAVAAERYRTAPDADVPAPALPAVELSGPAEAEAEDDALHVPENAELLRAYSAGPEWNAALGLWESHEAVDYRLDGDTVVSPCEGVVRTVGRSGVCGGFVEIESGGYLLRCASIAPRADLMPGDELSVGDPIGTADMSMSGEAALGAHLHLELLVNGNSADFAALADGD